jgi:hypothetical protein
VPSLVSAAPGAALLVDDLRGGLDVIRFPQAWPQPVVAAVAMLLLAALDLAGAWAAKEAASRRSPGMAVLGGLLFLLLFWVYASSLQYAELAPVTFGWVVLLQVGVLLLDRFRYQAPLPPGAWVAVVVLLAAQAYLLLAPTGGAVPSEGADPIMGQAVTDR